MSVVTIVRHRTADFDAWKKVYDSLNAVQKAGGVMAHGVFRDETDPNLVIVLHTFEDSAKAHAFVESSELKDGMSKAGVDLATLKVEFADEVFFGRL